MISIPSIVAATFSTFSWPYGCSTSAGSSALRTEMKAITDAIRSIAEWSASLRIATDPVIAAAASFRAIRTELEAIETAAAPGFVKRDPVLTDPTELIFGPPGRGGQPGRAPPGPGG